MENRKYSVNIEEGQRSVNKIAQQLKRTHSTRVLTGLNQFASAYDLNGLAKHPVLVSATDGVGTKLTLAVECNLYSSIGIDLVAMCANDILCLGATPLFFLDYIACHSLNADRISEIITGILSGCEMAGCSLVGGETAEMGNLYEESLFDLSGFIVGIVEKEGMITGKTIKAGDHVYGYPSSGLHSNGFSLVKKVLTPSICKNIGINYQDLLAPTRIYVKDILDICQKITVTGLAHITGGGLIDNISRILPKNCHLHIDTKHIPVLDIFRAIQSQGQVSEKEMWHVFNMGIGMVVITPEKVFPDKEVIYLGTIDEGKQGVELCFPN